MEVKRMGFGGYGRTVVVVVGSWDGGVMVVVVVMMIRVGVEGFEG